MTGKCRRRRNVRAHRTAAIIVVLPSSRGGGEHAVTADDGGKLRTFSWAVRIAVAVAVFSLGILVGAAVAAWVVPPV
jgi:hypothetical protein